MVLYGCAEVEGRKSFQDVQVKMSAGLVRESKAGGCDCASEQFRTDFRVNATRFLALKYFGES